ncbi:tyrosyl-DNA phosphodiesterase [Apiospora arundinis]|uniref:Tyrosyl-DNA phosphodiesterase n=1 Tax=Apiospora arundinis TaxID=335852 RepID=A0ABR2IVC8_9PEZI
MSEPPAKRRRLSEGQDPPTSPPSGVVAASESGRGHAASLDRPISPPPRRTPAPRERELLPSPFQLTTIRDLPAESNTGAVSLHDLLGDPLILECWEFNYLHDINFLMSHFDEDVRSSVKVHVVHGFWKREDPNRAALEQDASAFRNVELHTAYMPEMFGTHHSKMMILFRNDDTAQVVIHTANMISKDWTNMTNGVWSSPMLPLSKEEKQDFTIGSGYKFKSDLLSYLRAYNDKRSVCRSLVDSLAKYDFSAVRGTLIASVPGRHDVETDPRETRWGWAALKQAMRAIPVQPGKAEVVVQVSSIATLGGTDSWIQRTLFDSLSSAAKSTSRPSFKVVFPDASEIRRSLDGYSSGGSIHTKIQSAQQAKQLQYMRPIFCHWANDAKKGVKLAEDVTIEDAGRKRAAPHIKTYIRFGENSIDWALLTSANLSKQAWGEAATGSNEFRVASWEIGVLVWPELIAENAKMIGAFKTDLPSPAGLQGDDPLVGLRIPYSLPLQPYGEDEVPWVATMAYPEPDRMGLTWQGW